MYRQVVLPGDACLLSASDEYVPEFAWSWRDFFLVRRPLLAQADLETWSGARHDTPVPERANIYLYSGFGSAPTLELTTAERTTVVLLAAGGVLLYCLALLYLAPMSRPALVLVVACAALTLGSALIPMRRRSPCKPRCSAWCFRSRPCCSIAM